MIAKIYKKMYIRNLPFSVIVPVCCQMRLNVVFSGLFDNKKNRAVLEEIATFQAYSIAPYAKKFYRLLT